MIHSTEGILLKRYAQREYDEVLVFFTKKYGKIKLYAFGIKSPKSRRSRLLSSFHWLMLSYKIKKGRMELISLNRKEENDFLNDLKKFNYFLSILKIINDILPDEIPEPGLYNFIRCLAGLRGP